MKRALIFVAVFLVGVVVGIPIGARVGLWEFIAAEAQYKASILSTQLKSLRAGKTEPIITSMEGSLNGELANHGRYMESYLWWLWPELRSSDEDAIRRAVAYRLANPYQGPDLSKPESWKPGVDLDSEFVKRVIEGQRIEQHRLRKVLEHYRGSAHNSRIESDTYSARLPAPNSAPHSGR